VYIRSWYSALTLTRVDGRPAGQRPYESRIRSIAAPPELKELIRDVPGWLTDEEAEALYEAARSCGGRGAIVEIGSWKGKSTICLALGSRAGAGARVYAVDPHADYRFGDFKDNIERAGVEDLVTPVSSLSQPYADEFHEPVELLWIDGAHEYRLVLEDFEKWTPKVLEGGIVALHDTSWAEGPRRVANERILRSRHFNDARFVVGSTTMAREVAENSGTDRVKNLYVLALKETFASGSALLKKRRGLLPAPVEKLFRRLVGRLQ
jgi:predicted O-methyltransferase YrrM